jgi:hypothetical protein
MFGFDLPKDKEFVGRANSLILPLFPTLHTPKRTKVRESQCREEDAVLNNLIL